MGGGRIPLDLFEGRARVFPVSVSLPLLGFETETVSGNGLTVPGVGGGGVTAGSGDTHGARTAPTPSTG